ncbi:MAG: methionine synthase, partial [Firmicutes bacterium]|nr:methionine synthase [Bacillota bacterium]
NERLCSERPDLIRSIHKEYLDAGADIIETNSFGSNPIVLAEYGIAHEARALSRAAAKLALAEAKRASTPERPRFVAGAMGPTTKTLSVTGGTTFDDLADAYYEQAAGLIEGGADILLIETAQDTLNIKAAGVGIARARQELCSDLPIWISGTIEPMGSTLAGQPIDAVYVSVAHLQPLIVGLNCATGPEFMRDHLRTLAEIATSFVSVYPNAGLPDEDGHYHESPASLAAKLRGFALEGWVNVVGGCCGTTPAHIQALADAVRGLAPRRPQSQVVAAIAGVEAVYPQPDNQPLLVGERTNVIGSRKFKRLIAAGQYEEAADVARAQAKNGAALIDACLADPDRDELADMVRFLKVAAAKVRAPWLIDSTDQQVMEAALKLCQGKSVLNSVNLEDGEARFADAARLVHTYGAALVVGTIDESGMAVTCGRKLEIARRSYQLLTEKYGVPGRDIIFDPLVFPCGTGDENYIGSARETIEGIRQIKAALPLCRTILGISNVSFGLPPAGREALNSVFLYHCTVAGLDYAIVNTERLERYASLDEKSRQLCEQLLFATTEETLAAFAAHFREARVRAAATRTGTVDERLAAHIVEGSRDGLIPDLQEALAQSEPLSIINGPLMAGMEEVGRLFNRNELIVAEVLQSAEVMKAAVAWLEPHMEKKAAGGKGKIMLATVKGDVHDIGKNLVEIILANNGFEIVNLGIKVPPEQLIEAFVRERPDAIGLSGLLVKSAQQMAITARDLTHAGIRAPLLVGGAALTKKFATMRIAPEYEGEVLYARDAMEGLELANRLSRAGYISDPAATATTATEEGKAAAPSKAPAPVAVTAGAGVGETAAIGAPSMAAAVAQRSSQSTVATGSLLRPSGIADAPVHTPPDLVRHILRDYPVDMLVPYLNWQMLIGKHMGYRGPVLRRLREGEPRARELRALFDELLADSKRFGWLNPAAVYRFWPAQADGDSLLILDPQHMSDVVAEFAFVRQKAGSRLCLSDFVRDRSGGVVDYVSLFAVTAGHGVRERAQALKEAGEYLRSHALQALAIELAEAFAERLHHMLRDVWGFPDPPTMSMSERFRVRYQGVRVSFGYPACPELADQAKLFELLAPGDIGIELTDGYMMDPEASVSALVFSHPQARYFSVDAEADDPEGGEGEDDV